VTVPTPLAPGGSEVRIRQGRMDLLVRSVVDPEGLRLHLETGADRYLDLEVRLGARASLHLEERPGLESEPGDPPPPPLHLALIRPGRRGPRYLGHAGEAFEQAFAFARRSADLRDRAGARRAIEDLRLLLARQLRLLLDRADPAALGIARRFHPLARFHVYRLLAADRTTRVRQVALACPGLLLLTAGLEARGVDVGYLLERVVAGKRLTRLLDGAAAEVLLDELTRGEAERAAAREAPHVAAHASLGGSSPEGWVRRLRLLARRAGPRTSPLDLCGLPPPVLTPEDVPVEPRENARWFAVTRVACRSWLVDGVPPAAWGFVSRNARGIAGLVAETTDAAEDEVLRFAGCELARRTVERGLADGTWPARSADPLAVLRAQEHWGRRRGALLRPVSRLGRLLERVRTSRLGEVTSIVSLDPDGSDVGIVFPAYDGPHVEVRGVTLRPLTTAVELSAEGRRMDNCVATWCEKLVEGDRWIFGGRILGKLVTVELRRIGARYVVVQVARRHNAPITEPQRERLRAWLRALDGGGPRAPRPPPDSGLLL